jgi:hypothetical protein
MPKFIGVIAGAAEIAAGVALGIVSGFAATPLAGMLIAAGAGTLIGGLGTLLTKGPINGFASATQSPVGPWRIVYGRSREGGVEIYRQSWGGNNKMVDLVFVLAAHASQAVDVLMFDQQRIQIDTSKAPAGAAAGSGTSFTPAQQKVNIARIQRVKGVVTVTLNANIPYLIEGDRVQIAEDNPGVLTTNALVGMVQVAQILSQVVGSPGSIKFTYITGGTDCDITGNGHVNTLWADYGGKVYFEPLLGNQTLGQTFKGLVAGTPYDGDLHNIVNPDNQHGLGDGTPNIVNPWTANCSAQGKTLFHVRLHFSDQYFKGGLPQISVLMRGKNTILDPRTSPQTQAYTENAALCIADFLATAKNSGGYGAAYGTQIPYADLIAAANVCDEQVPLALSTVSPPITQPAYSCNGSFEVAQRPGELGTILQNLLTSCAARLTDYGGQFRIWPGAWRGYSFAIGSDPGGGVIPLGDFKTLAAGPIKWRPTVSRRDLYNAVKGTYRSRANKWMSTDFPPYAQDELHGYVHSPAIPEQDANLAADGGDRRYLDIQLPFTIESAMAQRIAKIELLRRRNWGTGTLIFNMRAYRITPMDNLLVTLEYLLWGTNSPSTPKQLEVLDARFHIEEGAKEEGEGPALLMEIDVQETDSSDFDWNTSEELSPQGYQQPAIPGIGSFGFSATELTPGFSIPFPWKAGYAGALVGDALITGPVVGSPAVNKGRATFGLQVEYGTTLEGNPTTNLDIKGTLPPNNLATISPPQITCAVGTSGSLPAGRYVVAASALDTSSPARLTRLSTQIAVTIPEQSPTADVGSIDITVSWPPDSNGGEIYMAENDAKEGYYFQTALTSADTATTLTYFDQSTAGAPDSTDDHLAVAWTKLIHGGVWDAQVQALTATTITLAGDAMTTNQWAGRVLSLLGKLDSTQELIVLNMPVLSSTASGAASPGASTSASITGTFTGNPANGQTAIIAGKTYTFETTLTDVDGNVQIGADEHHSILNLRAAVGLGSGAGTSYAASTTANSNAYAPTFPQPLSGITCYALLAGTGGNALTASGTAPITWSNGGTFEGGSAPGKFTVTIGPNSNGDQLADLRTLLVVGDLVLMRYNATFGPSSFGDLGIANSYYPQGATAVESGHVALVMTGPDAGDAQQIASVSQDADGNYTIIELAGTWKTQPNDGDIVIIVEAGWGPEQHTHSFSVLSRGAANGVVASPQVTNLAGKTWAVIVRTQTAGSDNGDDMFAAIREIYSFGSQGTRTITASQTMLLTDRIIDVDASAGPVVYTLLPFSQIPNRRMIFQKIDESNNPVTILCAGSPPVDDINGQPSVVLLNPDEPYFFDVSGNG